MNFKWVDELETRLVWPAERKQSTSSSYDLGNSFLLWSFFFFFCSCADEKKKDFVSSSVLSYFKAKSGSGLLGLYLHRKVVQLKWFLTEWPFSQHPLSVYSLEKKTNIEILGTEVRPFSESPSGLHHSYLLLAHTDISNIWSCVVPPLVNVTTVFMVTHPFSLFSYCFWQVLFLSSSDGGRSADCWFFFFF